MSGILVVGSHPQSNPSMKRYTHLLAESYAAMGHDVEIIRPRDTLSRKARGGLKKGLIYLEKLDALCRIANSAKDRTVHLADHSDAVYLAGLPRMRSIVTCHDMIAVRAALGELPEHRTRASGRLYQGLVRRGMLRAHKICAVSSTTAGDVKRILGRDAMLLRNPISRDLIGGSGESDASPYDDSYALIVSTIGWRKRRWLSVQAWLRLRKIHDASLRLVVVGPGLDVQEREIITRVAGSGALRDVTVESGVSDTRMSQLYGHAVCLLQMSKYEGFAWPIIEANYFGTLAVCADEPILRETGDGNVFIDASRIDEIEDAAWRRMLVTAISKERAEDLASRAKTFSVQEFERRLAECVQ